MALWVILLLIGIFISLGLALHALVFKRSDEDGCNKATNENLVNFLIIRVVLSIMLLITCYYYLSKFNVENL